MPRLIVTKGPDEGKQFDLVGDSISVGRDAASRIRMNDTEVSRRHAELVRTAEGYRILDKGSANGTYVNSQAVKDALLQPGDRVQVGQSVLVFSAGRREEPATDDLADRINLIARQDVELSGSIVGTIGETEGGRLLIRPDQAGGPWPKTALANLGVLYEATRAVSHILDLDELLERLLDLIFRALDPDRGCVLLCTEDGEQSDHTTGGKDFEPKAARWRDGSNRQEKIPISRTIVDHVLREKQGILVSDAARDERFQAVQSVVRLGIREVICVPMKGRHGTLGVLYLDTRTISDDGRPGLLRPGTSPGKFTADDLALAISLAHLGALAVEETRYHHAMVQAERLAAVGQTIAGLSHHIKNILQGLRTGGDIVNGGLADRDLDFLARGWKIVEKNQGKIEELVMDMLNYSKEREPTDRRRRSERPGKGRYRNSHEPGERQKRLPDSESGGDVNSLPRGLRRHPPIAAQPGQQRPGRCRRGRIAQDHGSDPERAERRMGPDRGDRQWHRRRAGQGQRHISSVRKLQGSTRHRPGPGRQPQNGPRAWGRHRRGKSAGPGQHVYRAPPPAAKQRQQRWHCNNSRHVRLLIPNLAAPARSSTMTQSQAVSRLDSAPRGRRPPQKCAARRTCSSIG